MRMSLSLLEGSNAVASGSRDGSACVKRFRVDVTRGRGFRSVGWTREDLTGGLRERRRVVLIRPREGSVSAGRPTHTHPINHSRPGGQGELRGRRGRVVI